LERTPGGFRNLDDVISQEELASVSLTYRRTTGFDPESLNRRPSRSVRTKPVIG
jgi:5-methylphenazine-1-carboxylate 1-monooxygenase